MATDVTSYNAKVGRVQGGDTFYMKVDGNFQFYNTVISGRELELDSISTKTTTVHASADTSVGSVLSPAYGAHVFNTTVSSIPNSAGIPAASYGAVLYLTASYLSSPGSVELTTTSATGLVLNVRGSDLSSLVLSVGNYLKMVCTVDGTWQVVEENNYTEQASS